MVVLNVRDHGVDDGLGNSEVETGQRLLRVACLCGLCKISVEFLLCAGQRSDTACGKYTLVCGLPEFVCRVYEVVHEALAVGLKRLSHFVEILVFETVAEILTKRLQCGLVSVFVLHLLSFLPRF